MKIKFCNFELDPASRQLWRGGEVVALEPKMFELLELLIQRRPAIVRNNELDEILWPNVYVARTSLTRLVSELRSALGDSPRDSRIIRTAYKAGYAFCAEVSAATPPRALPASVGLVWNDKLMLLPDGEYIAGRDAECSLVIDAVTVSRRHARITVTQGIATIEDLGSTNGTHVNGMTISLPTLIAGGHEVALGKAVLRVKRHDPAALTEKADIARLQRG